MKEKVVVVLTLFIKKYLCAMMKKKKSLNGRRGRV